MWERPRHRAKRGMTRQLLPETTRQPPMPGGPNRAQANVDMLKYLPGSSAARRVPTWVSCLPDGYLPGPPACPTGTYLGLLLARRVPTWASCCLEGTGRQGRRVQCGASWSRACPLCPDCRPCTAGVQPGQPEHTQGTHYRQNTEHTGTCSGRTVGRQWPDGWP